MSKANNPMVEQIDIVYPCHSKDFETLEICIKYARLNVKNLRNIYVVSRTEPILFEGSGSSRSVLGQYIWISEDKFPFKYEDMVELIGDHWRTGWYYAGWFQLLSIIYIPGILDNVLTCDSDTIFLKPIEFVDKDGKSLFNISPSDGTGMYFEHMEKLVPNLKPQIERPWSGVAHHILINRKIMNHLIESVESDKRFKEKGWPFWKAWVGVSQENYNTAPNDGKPNYIGNDRHKNGPGRVTSYELYFNYALKYFKSDVKIRKLDSIMAYKGYLNVKNKKFIRDKSKSRTNQRGPFQVIDPQVEKENQFETLKECLEFHIDGCIKHGFDTVTFQNHTREGSGSITKNCCGSKR